MVSCSQLIMMVLVVMGMCWAVRRGLMSLPGERCELRRRWCCLGLCVRPSAAILDADAAAAAVAGACVGNIYGSIIIVVIRSDRMTTQPLCCNK
jgi:hypothetical protein